MKAKFLPALVDWEQFDGIAEALQFMGWTPVEIVDGPDARVWAFSRAGESLWLIFDDLLGGELKSESASLNLEAVALQLRLAAG